MVGFGANVLQTTDIASSALGSPRSFSDNALLQRSAFSVRTKFSRSTVILLRDPLFRPLHFFAQSLRPPWSIGSHGLQLKFALFEVKHGPSRRCRMTNNIARSCGFATCS